MMVSCADCVICFPERARGERLRDACRLIASGTRPLPRRIALAHSATLRERRIWNDRAPAWLLNQAIDQMAKGRTCVVTANGINELGAPDSRSHPAQLTRVESFELSPSSHFWVAHSEVAGANLAAPEADYGRLAWGSHPSRDQARIRAEGEAVERFASGNIRSSDLTHESMTQLSGKVIDPRTVTNYRDCQIERSSSLRKFQSSDLRYWVRGRGSAGDPTWVLADLVYYPFAARGGVHCHTSSSGVAAGPTRSFADRNALRECCERDAVMRWWYGISNAYRIIDAFQSPFARAAHDFLRRQRISINVYDISTTLGTVIMAAAFGKGTTVITASCSIPVKAVERALEEVVVNVSTNDPTASDLEAIRPSEVQSPLDHLRYYSQPVEQAHLSELLSGTRSRSMAEVIAKIPEPCDHEIVFVDLPTTTMSQLYVSRCIFPGLIPLAFGWDSDPLGLEELAHLNDGPLQPHPFG